MKINQLQFNGSTINIYLHEYADENVMMCAIPYIFWSIELSLDLDLDEIHEELLMQFFNFYSENEADALARDICDWIATNYKENDE